MPTFKRKRPGRRGYNDADIWHLLDGKDYFSSFGYGEGRNTFDEEAFAEAWLLLQNELLPGYIAAHRGRRPFAWWAIDAPELREQIILDAKAGWRPLPDKGFSWGYPYCFEPIGETEDRLPASELETMYESQRDYLQRLGLLTEADTLTPHHGGKQ